MDDSTHSHCFFSVVITTYNRAILLQRALKSLVSQTEKSWEAIIVDDGSTDDTFRHVMPYLQTSRNIRYLWKPHSGNASSRNTGIDLSSGSFITFLDSDDEYRSDHLKTRKKFLLARPCIRFLYGGVRVLGNPCVPDKNDPSRKIYLKDCAIGGSFVVAREVMKLLDGFRDIVLGSDSDLLERAEKEKVRIAEISDPTYIYHHENQDSITNRLNQKLGIVST